MNKQERQIIEQIKLILNEILQGKSADLIHVNNCPESLHDLVNTTNYLIKTILEIRDFVLPLSKGEIEVGPPNSRNLLASPIKELQSQLRTLVWQVQQVAKGDYNQRVYFMGDFSRSFNKMVESLEEKERLLSKRLEDNIQYYSKYDPLTKVPNRTFLKIIIMKFLKQKTMMYMEH